MSPPKSPDQTTPSNSEVGEDQFLGLADRLPVIVWRSDLTGRTVYFNHAWEEFVGLEAASSPGAGWRENLHPEDRERAVEVCGRHHLERTPFHSDYRIRRADGEFRWLVDSGVPLFDEQGSFSGFLGAVHDITDRVLAEREVRKQAELLLQAARLAQIGAWELDVGAKSLRWSEEVYRIHELEIGTVVSLEGAVNFYAPAARPIIESAVIRGMRDGSGWDLKLQIITSKGHPRWVRAIGASEVRDGVCARLFGTFQDISDEVEAAEAQRKSEEARLLLERQLHQAQKMDALGTLAGGIAHDFNNVLAALMGTLEIMELQAPPGREFLGYVRQGLDACDRAKSLVSQILTFSRQEHGQQKPCDLCAVVREGLLLLRAAHPATITLACDTPSIPCAVKGDSSQLYQVLMNLVTNAAQAVPENGGRVHVELAEVVLTAKEAELLPELSAREVVRLRVHDNGSGISSDILPRIFEPFFTTREPGKGTGLGLSVVHGIVSAHHGAIRAQSTPGIGTTFSVYFPECNEPSEFSAHPAAPPRPRGAHERIWIVDDEGGLADVTAKLLELSGYEAIARHQSASALREILQDPSVVDLILVDFTMPEMDGIEFVRRIRSAGLKTSIIMVSGIRDPRFKALVDCGVVSAVLEKPVSGDHLCAAIHCALVR